MQILPANVVNMLHRALKYVRGRYLCVFSLKILENSTNFLSIIFND